MKLDSRIIEGKKPLDCIDAENEEVQSFIGKEGYFSNHISGFIDISDLETERSVLTAINPDEPDREVYKSNRTTWEYFLPAEWVKPEESEKKYRPYSLEEFFKIFKVGDLIVFRMKIFDEIKCAMFTGYITDGFRIDDKKPGACEVMLGCFRYSLFSLFEDFELFNGITGEWLPFGVIDE